jgi:chromosome segregation ATPase
MVNTDNTDSESEKIVPFDADHLARVLKELRDKAATRMERIHKERATLEGQLSQVEGELPLVEAQLKDLTATRDRLKRELVGLKAEEAALKDTLGGKELAKDKEAS